MLCISISKLVLRMPFAGRNHFLSTKTSISIFFCHKQKKRKENTKMTKSMHKKGSTSIKVLHLNAGWHPKAAFFCYFLRFHIFFFHLWRKKTKNLFICKKMISTSKQYAEQPFAGWNQMKYTTKEHGLLAWEEVTFKCICPGKNGF